MRGGIFDRIQLVQGDISVRFRDRQNRRIRVVAAEGAPKFTEKDIFKIPADSGFDPTRPFRIQLLVQRAVGPVEKTFLTYDLGYNIPPRYLTLLTPATPAVAVIDTEGDSAARTELWQRIWRGKKVEIALLIGMLTVLTGVFFFQFQATRHARAFYWFRMGFLAMTLGFLGFAQNAQLSVVNLMALVASMREGFWLGCLFDGPAGVYLMGLGCCHHSVLGQRRLLWLVMPVWGFARNHQPDRTVFQGATMDPAMGPAMSVCGR